MNDFDIVDILESLELLKQLVELSHDGFDFEDSESVMIFLRFDELTSQDQF